MQYSPTDNEVPSKNFNDSDPTVPGINDEQIVNSEDSDAIISDEELVLLDEAGDGEANKDLAVAELDNSDDDGELLNKVSDISGDDLDVPGSEEDDVDETTGSEDEENNIYSHGSDKEDRNEALS